MESKGPISVMDEEFSVKRRWAHDFAMGRSDYAELPLPTTNNGASLVTQPSTPLPLREYTWSTSSDEPECAFKAMEASIFLGRLEIALLDRMIKDENFRVQALPWFLSVSLRGSSREESVESHSPAADREWKESPLPSDDEYAHSYMEDSYMEHMGNEANEENEENEEHEEHGENEDLFTAIDEEEVSQSTAPETPIEETQEADDSSSWDLFPHIGTKRKASCLEQDPLDAEQPDEVTAWDDKFEDSSFAGSSQGDDDIWC